MRLVLSIGVGLAGAAAAVLLHGVVADVLGGAVAIGALVVITRAVIRLAAEAPGPRDATSALRRDPHLE